MYFDLPYNLETVYEEPLVEVTQSSLSTFQLCQTRYAFRYMLRLVPRAAAIPLIVGTAVHKGLERLMMPEGGDIETRLRNALFQADAEFDRVLENSDQLMSINVEKLEHGRCQAHAILESWSVLNGDCSDMFRVEHTELTIHGVEGATRFSPLRDRAAGRIDAIVVDSEGVCWIFESKTRRSLNNLSFLAGLGIHQQSLWYVMLYNAYAARTATDTVGVRLPNGIFFNGMAKPQHRSGNTFEEKRDRMKKAIMEDPSKYMLLQPAEFDGKALLWAIENWKSVVLDMDEAGRRHSWSRNLNACDQFGGCPYRSICHNLGDANKPGDVLKMPEMSNFNMEDPHGELKDEELPEEEFV